LVFFNQDYGYKAERRDSDNHRNPQVENHAHATSSFSTWRERGIGIT